MDTSTSHSNPLMTMLSYHITNHNGVKPPQLTLLLPLARKHLTGERRVTTIDMLYRAIYMLPRDYDSVTINHATGLILPLATILYLVSTSSYKLPQNLKAMAVSDVFQLHPSDQFLQWKDTAYTSLLLWKQAPRQLFRGIESGDIKLQPFFLPLCNPTAVIDTTSTSVSLRPFIQKLLPMNATNGPPINP